MITLVAILCFGPLCLDEVVPTQMMVAGKADAPISVPLSWGMCQSDGIKISADWLSHQEQYHGWRLARVMCVPGHYEPSKRA